MGKLAVRLYLIVVLLLSIAGLILLAYSFGYEDGWSSREPENVPTQTMPSPPMFRPDSVQGILLPDCQREDFLWQMGVALGVFGDSSFEKKLTEFARFDWT